MAERITRTAGAGAPTRADNDDAAGAHDASRDQAPAGARREAEVQISHAPGTQTLLAPRKPLGNAHVMAGAPAHVVVLLHGYAADARQMAPLAQRVQATLPEAAVLLMNGPENLNRPHVPGLQWFDLRLGNPADCAVQAAGAAQSLTDRLAAALADGVDQDAAPQVDLIGYSQGALTAFAAASRIAQSGVRLRRLVSVNGALPDPQDFAGDWPAGVDVSFVHGADDVVIPVASMHRSAATLRGCGAQVEEIVVPAAGHGLRAGVIAEAVGQLAPHRTDIA